MNRLLLTATYPIAQLRPHPRNYKWHDLEGLKSRLRKGETRTIVVRADDPEQPLAGGTILAGHGIVEAATALRRKAIGATVVECDDEEAEEVLVEDNRQAELGTDDPARLVRLLHRIQARGGLEEVGYTEREVADLLAEATAGDNPEPAPAAVVVASPPPPPGLSQTVLQFREAAAHAAFLADVEVLRERYGGQGVTAVVVEAVRRQELAP